VSKQPTRTIKVDTLARVEGEGALYIKLKGDQVQDVKLSIYEPPRSLRPFCATAFTPKFRTLSPASAEFVLSRIR